MAGPTQSPEGERESMSDTLYLGIDPGKSGGIVALCQDDVWLTKMPPTLIEIWNWINESVAYGRKRGRVVAGIERVGGFMRQGEGAGSKNFASGHSMWEFGFNVGILHMALVGNGVTDFRVIAPVSWQRGLQIPKREKGESKTGWKARLKALAQLTFPEVEITLGTADAILIAEYIRRKHRGDLPEPSPAAAAADEGMPSGDRGDHGEEERSESDDVEF